MKSRSNWFNGGKGYNFTDYNERESIFIHYSTIRSKEYKTLLEGQIIHLNLINANKRY